VTRKAQGRRAAAAARKWAERPLAAQRHLASCLMAAFAGDFERYGAETLARFRLENPANYVRIVAGLLPKDLDDENLLDKVSDEELYDVIVQLRALAARPDESRGPIRRPE
jgi:hypothetical protein